MLTSMTATASPITAKDGLLWRDGAVIDLPEADSIAIAHGHMCAERMVRALSQRVVCAANRDRFGTLVIGPRHFDPTMRNQIDHRVATGDDPAWWRTSEQGFINQWGEFLTRAEAAKIALANGQVKELRYLKGELDSSDLY